MSDKVWPFKDPGEKLDYGAKWRKRMEADSDTIATSNWRVDDGDVQISVSPPPTGYSNVTYQTTVWLEGGTVDTFSVVTNYITTTGGRTWEQSFKLPIKQRGFRG